MDKIMSSEELSNYYRAIQGFLMDKYINTHKVSVSELVNYVENNIDDIIVEVNFVGVFNAKKIIIDVVRHLYHSEQDRVMTFESFKKVM